jgi:hypothetical protein
MHNEAEERAEVALRAAAIERTDLRAEAIALAFQRLAPPRLSEGLSQQVAMAGFWAVDVHHAAEALRLPGGHRCWIVDGVIAGGGRFYSHLLDVYVDAETLLANPDSRDYPEVVEAARRFAEFWAKRPRSPLRLVGLL